MHGRHVRAGVLVFGPNWVVLEKAFRLCQPGVPPTLGTVSGGGWSPRAKPFWQVPIHPGLGELRLVADNWTCHHTNLRGIAAGIWDPGTEELGCDHFLKNWCLYPDRFRSYPRIVVHQTVYPFSGTWRVQVQVCIRVGHGQALANSSSSSE